MQKFIIGTCPECKSVVAGSLDVGTNQERAEFIFEALECGLNVTKIEAETISLSACKPNCSRK